MSSNMGSASREAVFTFDRVGGDEVFVYTLYQVGSRSFLRVTSDEGTRDPGGAFLGTVTSEVDDDYEIIVDSNVKYAITLGAFDADGVAISDISEVLKSQTYDGGAFVSGAEFGTDTGVSSNKDVLFTFNANKSLGAEERSIVVTFTELLPDGSVEVPLVRVYEIRQGAGAVVSVTYDPVRRLMVLLLVVPLMYLLIFRMMVLGRLLQKMLLFSRL